MGKESNSSGCIKLLELTTILRTTNSNKMLFPWPLPGTHCGDHFDDVHYLLNKKVYFPTWMENAANTLNANLKLWLSNTGLHKKPVLILGCLTTIEIFDHFENRQLSIRSWSIPVWLYKSDSNLQRSRAAVNIIYHPWLCGWVSAWEAEDLELISTFENNLFKKVHSYFLKGSRQPVPVRSRAAVNIIYHPWLCGWVSAWEAEDLELISTFENNLFKICQIP
ncbi:hypothetical protein OUZ56_017695 [Daphnia magna]|uniref:Uncharacterized protein n=1 Tax=Daphnia magna TaxID=35525 RepID=A0ABR0ATE9_9CRUS|nr:hypothetical protein OUZ56_017695 [Daphnia magna]